MPRYAYERLSAQDASFLFAEGDNQPMHVGAVAILEAGPLRTGEGGIDIGRYRRTVESVLHWIPRYRQKLAWVPLEGWPVWVDDRHFDLGYHIRHLSLPRPGTLDQLKELASRILARPLDRAKPLWEIWVIEGLEGGEQFALLNKIHHCMVDGAAGADLSQILMSPSSSVEPCEPLPYLPRPAPSGLELWSHSLLRHAGRPLELLRKASRRTDGADEETSPGLRRRARALAGLASFALRPASDTPINGELGPHRRLDWLTMPLEDVLELRHALGCTLNDIVLATVAGALRRYLFRRRVDAGPLDFRVAAPVSVRRDSHERRHGNHVSTWILRLPLGEADPLKQLAAIRDRTAELKRTEAALGVETLMAAAEWLPAPILAMGAGLAQGPANMIVTNIPGPQFPLFIVGARLLGMYPAVPLIPGSGLGVALFSYEGKLCWGFNADYELVPDIPALADDVRSAFEELRRAAVAHFLEQRTAVAETPAPRSVRPGEKKTKNGRARRRPRSAGSPIPPGPRGAAAPAPPTGSPRSADAPGPSGGSHPPG